MPQGQRISRAYVPVRASRPRPPDDPHRSADEALLRFVLGRSDADDDEDEVRSRPPDESHIHTWYDQRDVRHDVDCTCVVGADHTTSSPGGRDR